MYFGLTARGENIGQWNSPSAPLRMSHIANGAVVTPPALVKPPDPAWRAVVDPRTAVVVATSKEFWLKWNDSNYDPSTGTADCGRLTTTNDYDAASRLVGTTTSQSRSTDPHCDIGADSQSTIRYSYDAENHHIGSNGASWSPNGRAYNLEGTTVHYAGAMPIFGSDAQGALVGVKVETLADIDASGQLTVWDRDYSGLLQTGHNNSAYYPVNLGNVMVAGQATSGVFNGSAGSAGWTAFLPYTRLEGFDFHGLTFQGARAVEAASGQWTTPDMAAGNVHDPTSQKPFMWDRNNAYEYSDPSGFTPNRLADCGCSGGGYESIDAAKERARGEAENRAMAELAQEFFIEWPLIEMLRSWMRVGGESLPQDVAENIAKMEPKFEEGRLADHARHFADFGAKNATEYLKAARDFLNEAKNGRFQTKWDPKERTLRFYDEQTNRFGAFRLDGIIRTFFKPNIKGGGQKYFNDQPGSKLTPLANFDA
jgi:YD repeat-containing protein